MADGQAIQVRRDILAGIAVAILSLPTCIGVGLVALAPLGPGFAALGVHAGLVAGVFLPLIPALVRSSPFNHLGPGPALAGITGTAFAGLTAVPLVGQAVAQGNGPLVLGLLAVAGVVAALTQIILAAFDLGRLIKLVPMPVVAGVVNGVAVLVVIGQIPAAIGLRPPGGGAVPTEVMEGSGLAIGLAVNPWDILISAAAILTALLVRRFARGWPPPLFGLIAATTLWHGLQLAGLGGQLGPTVGPLPGALPTLEGLHGLRHLLTAPGGRDLALTMAGTGVTLGVLGALTTLLTATAADNLAAFRHSPRRELLGAGMANLLSALFGGLAGGGNITRLTNGYASGGRGRLVHLSCAVTTLAVLGGLGPVVSTIPLAAVAGSLLFMAAQFIDGWSLRTAARLWREGPTAGQGKLAVNLVLSLAVTVAVLVGGLLNAVLIGCIGALFTVVAESSRTLVRRRLSMRDARSNTVRTAQESEALRAAGDKVCLLELQGPLFFGTADTLADTVENATRDGGAETVILDLRRVTEIDPSSLQVLHRTAARLNEAGRLLTLAYLPAGLEAADLAGKARIFPDTNAALAWAEERLLAAVLGPTEEERRLPLARSDLMRGLSDQAVRIVADHLRRTVFAAGDSIIREGDRGDSLLVVVQGRVCVSKHLGNGRSIVLARYGTGVTVGEMGFLTGAPRTADVVAETDGAGFFLPRPAFHQLAREAPEAALAVSLNLSRILAQRLGSTSEALRALEG